MKLLSLSGLPLLFSVDRVIAIAIALTNVVGNTIAVLVLARWEGRSPASSLTPPFDGNPEKRWSRIWPQTQNHRVFLERSAQKRLCVSTLWQRQFQ